MKNLFMVPAILVFVFSGPTFSQQKATIAVGEIEYQAKRILPKINITVLMDKIPVKTQEHSLTC